MAADEIAYEDEFRYVPAQWRELGGTGSPPPVRRVQLARGRISALRWGTGPVEAVFLHGAGLNAHTFDETVLALGRPALVLDLPGHGRSPWRDDADYRPHVNVPVVAQALREVPGADHATLIGHSLGGATALALLDPPGRGTCGPGEAQGRETARPADESAATVGSPPRPAHRVLIDVTPDVRFADAAPIFEAISSIPADVTREDIARTVIDAGLSADPVLVERSVALNTKVNESGHAAFLHHLTRPDTVNVLTGTWRDLWPSLQRFAPVTLVRGTDGFITPERVAALRDRVPHAEIVNLAAGHNVQEQRPRELAAVIAARLP